ncbi:MAG TPA: hypothetical protein P5137_00695 [Candidatus Brocadiia bacterium]|nr:hypothetical protein [Candidatus Brocadiia bacterium]
MTVFRKSASLPAVLLCALLAAPAWAAGSASIVVPAGSIMDLEEGTIEAWVKLNFNPRHENSDRWKSVGSLCLMEIPKTTADLGASIHAGWGLETTKRFDQVTRRATFRVAFVVNGQQLPHPALADATDWGQGAWRHVAFTWRNGREMRVYVDGKLAGERLFPTPARRDIPSSARLVLGLPGYIASNAITVDEIRISSVARRPEELGFHHVPLRPDPCTLYMEGFENVTEEKGKRMTRPFLVERDGEAFEVKGGAVVEGKSGAGFCFDPQSLAPAAGPAGKQ